MKKFILTAVAAVATSASFAQVFDMPGELEERSIQFGEGGGRNTPTVVYSAIPGPYNAFTARTGSLGFEDYTSIFGGPFTLDSMRFVGGVTVAGGTINVSFFDAAQNFVGGFNTTLGSAGNFIYTISGLSALNLVLPDSGIVQISATSGALGQWFLGAGAPTIGTNDSTFGGGNNGALNHRFELTAVPEPGTMAVLGLGAAAMLRRRKKA